MLQTAAPPTRSVSVMAIDQLRGAAYRPSAPITSSAQVKEMALQGLLIRLQSSFSFGKVEGAPCRLGWLGGELRGGDHARQDWAGLGKSDCGSPVKARPAPADPVSVPPPEDSVQDSGFTGDGDTHCSY